MSSSKLINIVPIIFDIIIVVVVSIVPIGRQVYKYGRVIHIYVIWNILCWYFKAICHRGWLFEANKNTPLICCTITNTDIIDNTV